MDSIKRLQQLFSRFPTIGSRTAGRFVFYLIRQPKETIDELILALQALKQSIKLCDFCFNPHELQDRFCGICQERLTKSTLLCIVEKEQDLLSIEQTQKYKGVYFILGGTITARDIDGDHLRLAALGERIGAHNFTEVIIALNPTSHGRATSVLVERVIKESPKSSSLKITHLGRGIPFGGELEYADEETLESAFEGRK